MNLLFILVTIFSGLAAGLASFLISGNISAWNIAADFRFALFAETAFCGVFCALSTALPMLIVEKKSSKFLNRCLSNGSLGAVMGTAGTVVFKMTIDILSISENFLGSSGMFFQWLIPAISLSIAYAFIFGVKTGFAKSIMSFTPAFVVAGTLIDRLHGYVADGLWQCLLLGLVVGSGFGIVWDCLKSSWLEEKTGGRFVHRYYLDSDSFWIGSSNDCDLTVEKGADLIIQINEKDGMYILETDENSEIAVNNKRVRYKVLEEGDCILVEGHTFVFHTNVNRVKDSVPADLFGT